MPGSTRPGDTGGVEDGYEVGGQGRVHTGAGTHGSAGAETAAEALCLHDDEVRREEGSEGEEGHGGNEGAEKRLGKWAGEGGWANGLRGVGKARPHGGVGKD